MKSAIEKHVGRRLRQARKRRGYTQEELAILTGNGAVSRISQWETGSRQMDYASLVRVARACGISVGWLFRDFDEWDLEEEPPFPLTG